MKFGTKIKMLRNYDGTRYAAGAVYKVGLGEPEDGLIRPNVAASLCTEALDGKGAYAEVVEEEESESIDEDKE